MFSENAAESGEKVLRGRESKGSVKLSKGEGERDKGSGNWEGIEGILEEEDEEEVMVVVVVVVVGKGLRVVVGSASARSSNSDNPHPKSLRHPIVFIDEVTARPSIDVITCPEAKG